MTFVESSQELSEAPPTTETVVRLGVSVRGDAPPLSFSRTDSPCSTNSGRGDLGTEVPGKGGGCWKAINAGDLEVREFGAKCDGLTDDARAVAAADAAASRLPNGRVLFPAASCSISSPITVPDSITWQGKGAIQTAILIRFPAGDAIIAHNAVHIGDMGFAMAPGISRSSGSFVTFSGSGDTLEGFVMKGYVVGINLAGSSATDLVVVPTITNGRFFEPSTSRPDSTVAIYIQNFSSASVSNVTISGYANAQAPAHSVLVRNGDTLFIDKINATLHGTFAVTPGSGENTYSVRISNALFDSAGVGTGKAGVDACILAGSGGIFDTQMSNVWCGLSTGTGLLIAPTSGGTVQGVDIANIQAVGNHSDSASVANSGIRMGSQLGGTVAYINITGGCSSGNANPRNDGSAWALWLNGSVSHVGVTNFIGGNCDGRGKNSNGLKIDSTVDYVRLNALDFSGNVGLAYSNSSRGTHFQPKDLTRSLIQ